MLRKLGTNFAYSFALNFANVAFPIVMIPYTARVLGPLGVGRINYAMNLVSYCLLLSTFGLQVYGVREIARAKRDPKHMAAVASNLFTISAAITVVAFAAFFAAIFMLPAHSIDIAVCVVFSATIVSNAFALDWFFAGMEDFRYIAIRNGIIKALSLPLVLLLVNGSDDVLVFACISAAAAALPSAANFYYARRIAGIRLVSKPEFHHFKAMASFFFISIISSIASTLPVTRLGVWKDAFDVGIFTTAYKVIVLVLMLLNSLSVVVYPHLSASFLKDNGEYQKTANAVFRVLNMIAIPAAIGILVLGDRIALALGGVEFASAGTLVSALSLVVLFSVNSSFFVQQILYPAGQEARVLKGTIIVAMIAAITDVALISRYGVTGALSGLIVSEGTMLAVMAWNVWKAQSLKLDVWPSGMYILLSLPLLAVTSLMNVMFSRTNVAGVFVIAFVGGGVYVATLILFKDALLMSVVTRVLKRRN